MASLEGGRTTASRSAPVWRRSTRCSSSSSAGDHVICGDNVYGGTIGSWTGSTSALGLSLFASSTCATSSNVERAVTPATRMVYCETPTNPMMFLADLAAMGDICQARGLLFVVDNTFATPVSSSGRSSTAPTWSSTPPPSTSTATATWSGGMLVTRRDDLAERLGFIQNAAGGVPGPMDCWLALRGHQDAAAPDAPARRQRPGRSPSG